MTTGMSTLSPRTLWAQDQCQVFVTFEIFEGKDIKVDFQKDKISFSGIQAEGEQKYEVELELFDEVVPEKCRQHYTPRAIICTMEKANEGPFWPRLIKAKTKPHFIHIDFSRWVDENEDEDDPEANAPMDPNMFMNFAGAGAGAQYGDDSFEDAMEESSSDEEGKDLEMPALE